MVHRERWLFVKRQGCSWREEAFTKRGGCSSTYEWDVDVVGRKEEQWNSDKST